MRISTSTRIVTVAAVALVGLVAVLVLRACSAESRQPDAAPAELPEVADGAVGRLAESVRFQTTSPTDFDATELAPFDEFHGFLKRSFPRTHETLGREEIGPCSALYTWTGTDPNKRPALLMSHTDVVPVEPDERDSWTHPPYSGAVDDGFIWGRGTLDIKSGVVGILEATETLLEDGFQPERTFMFAFGCDEEVGGKKGARQIARTLEKRGTELAFVLDEGHAITRGIVPGIERPVALVGLSEKGFVTLKLTARAKGGHSSMPPKNTSIGILSRALTRIEENPFPARLNEPARQMFRTLGPEFPPLRQVVFANLWLFEPLLLSQLSAKNTTNATIRTTTAVTVVRGGVQDNILPKRATAKVNFRIAPGETMEDVKEHVRRVVDDDRVTIEMPEQGFASNPSPVSDTDTEAFRTIRNGVRGIFGEEALVAPALTVGGTDSRYFTDLADDVYRFIPMILDPDDPERIHGVDERLGVENYRNIVRFYMYILTH